MNRDLVGVIEAAYAIERTSSEWLTELCAASAPWLDQGMGMFAALYDASDPKDLRMTGITGLGIPPEGMDAIRFGAAAAGQAIVKRLRTQTCGTLRSELGPKASRMPAMIAARAAVGVKDVLGLNAQDPTLCGVAFAAPMREVREFDERFQRTWTRVAAHIAASFRLRRQVESGVQRADAILEPAGKIVHLEDLAIDEQSQLALRGAAAAIDKARCRDGGREEEAVGAWQALVLGRWSLVDTFERDGRRYVVARKNDPFVPGKNLSLRERQVAGFAALGHSNKLIAYELGVSVSTVATQLASAMAKLGLTSRVQLIQTYDALKL